MMLHDSTPDVDNCLKAFMDSLLPEDKHIADLRITKKWINSDAGRIEISLTTPIHSSSDTLV